MPKTESLAATPGHSRGAALTGAQWKVIILASLGGALEFYDFIIYGVFAQSIAGAFFPTSDPLISLVLSFSVFAGGYLARPLGGLLLGALGDRIGRRRIFVASLMAISVSTTLMGLLPTYATLGFGAGLMMIALRLIQGFCLGGELPCSVVYVVETVPRRAGFVCGVLIFCVNTGVGLAALVSLALYTVLTPAEVASYGWRVGFLVGGLTGALSYFLRRQLNESAEFQAMKGHAADRPMAEVFRERPMAVLIGIGSCAGTAAFNGLLFAYMPSYLTRVLHYEPKLAALAQNVGLGVLSAAILLVGYLADLVPRRYLMATGAAVLAVFSYPFFQAVSGGSANVLLLFAAAGLVAAFCNGVFASIIADLFPTRIRFSGVAVVYNVSMTAFGGTVPLLASSLVASTGSVESPAYLMTGFAVLALVSSLASGRHGGCILDPGPGHVPLAVPGPLPDTRLAG